MLKKTHDSPKLVSFMWSNRKRKPTTTDFKKITKNLSHVKDLDLSREEKYLEVRR